MNGQAKDHTFRISIKFEKIMLSQVLNPLLASPCHTLHQLGSLALHKFKGLDVNTERAS